MADETRCKETVYPNDRWGAFHPHQCSRKAVKDGYCKTHHPDVVKDRQAKNHAKYLEKMERESPYHAAQKARLAALIEVREMVEFLISNKMDTRVLTDDIDGMIAVLQPNHAISSSGE